MRQCLLGFLLLVLPAAALGQQVGDKATVGGDTYKGREIITPLPDELRMKNSGGSDGPRGPGSGSGLCVWTSIAHAARWQYVVCLFELQEYMKHFPGGGWPGRVNEVLPKLAKKLGAETPRYAQYSGTDEAMVDLAMKTGRMVCTTYGYSERYQRMSGSGRVAHMVNLVYLDPPGTRGGDELAGVLDNNFPHTIEWMSRAEYFRRAKMQMDPRMRPQLWIVVLLDAPPPPLPYRVVAQLQPEAKPMIGLLAALTLTAYAPAPQIEFIQASKQGQSHAQPGGAAQNATELPTGVRQDKMQAGEHHEVQGEKCDRQRFCQVITQGTLVDDSSMGHVVAVCKTAEKAAEMRKEWDSHPSYAPFREKYLFHAYPVSSFHAQVFNVGKMSPTPEVALFVQPKADKDNMAPVLHAQFDYAGGADAFAGTLRKVDSTWDPLKLPDLRKPVPPPPTPAPQPGPPSPAPSPFWSMVSAPWAITILCVVTLFLVLVGPRLQAAAVAAQKAAEDKQRADAELRKKELEDVVKAVFAQHVAQQPPAAKP